MVTVAVVAVVAALVGGTAGWMAYRSRIAPDLFETARIVGADPDPTPERTIAAIKRAARARAEEQQRLDDQFDRFVKAADSLTQGIVVTDDASSIVYSNRKAGEFLGGRHGDALVADAIRSLAERARSAGRADREVAIYGPPETTLFVSATSLEDSGGVIVIIDDVSDRHRLDAVRRDLVANVSHELKTPVAAVSLLAETMQEEDDPEVLRGLAERAHREAMRVGRIIEELLDLSRLERAGAGDHREPVRVADVVTEAIGRVGDLAASRDTTINTDDTDVIAELDHSQIVSAIANLLENAVKYSAEGSSVNVRVAHHHRDLSIAVEDKGVGIPQSAVDRIFERFYRVDRGRSRETGGTGLGLSIVRHIALNHGGTVEVTTREGLGSTFTMMLPGVLVDTADEDASEELR